MTRFIAIQTNEPLATGYDWLLLDTWTGRVVHRNLNVEQAILLAAAREDKYSVDYSQF